MDALDLAEFPDDLTKLRQQMIAARQDTVQLKEASDVLQGANVAAGLRMVLISDPAITAKVECLYEERDVKQVRLNNDSRKSKGRQSLKLCTPTRSEDIAAAA